MIYLVGKISILLFLAALVGFYLGRWWVTRQFEDVTEQYYRMFHLSPEKPAVDGQVMRALHEISEQLPDAEQLQAQEVRLREIEDKIGEAPANALDAQESRMHQDLRQLTERIEGEPPIQDALLQISAKFETMRQEVLRDDGVAPLREQLLSVQERLTSIEQAIHQLQPAQDANLQKPLQSRLAGIQDALRGMKSQPLPRVEASARARPSTQALLARAEASRVQGRGGGEVSGVVGAAIGSHEGNPAENLPAKAKFGEQDDLKRIDGIGPKLEALLNALGVYYFWQIAQWTDEDVRRVDAKLGSFRGRIERDGWIAQATEMNTKSESGILSQDIVSSRA